jgi:sugar-specific transcriptional regulator TrmB
MIIRQDLINKIKDYFDLNVYETKVWLALLGKGIASAGEIAEASGVPRSRTYDVLENLEKRGFAIEKLGKPVKYLGVKPHVILEKLKNNVKTDADERVESLSKIRQTTEFENLESLYTEGINPIKREDLTAAIKGKSMISNYLKEILEDAKEEVIICSNADEIASKQKLFGQTITLLKKANIGIKMALSGDKALIADLSKTFGIKISAISIDSKFYIIDKREILFYLSNKNSNEDTAIWLNSEFFATAFATLFDKAVSQ